eukprot:4398238-Prymnesium_polylepis.1
MRGLRWLHSQPRGRRVACAPEIHKPGFAFWALAGRGWFKPWQPFSWDHRQQTPNRLELYYVLGIPTKDSPQA